MRFLCDYDNEEEKEEDIMILTIILICLDSVSVGCPAVYEKIYNLKKKYLLGMRSNVNKHFIPSIKTTIRSCTFLPSAIV